MWDRMAAARRRRSIRRWLIGVVSTVLVVALVVAGWWWAERARPPRPAEQAVPGFTVSVVFDGDTVVVVGADGSERTVRLVGVNAPETAHGAVAGECFGDEARGVLASLLPRGSPVVLVIDPLLPTDDPYGRRLAYVEVSGVDVGRALLDRGAAVVYELRSQATPSRSLPYREAEGTARAARAGLWGACSSPPSRSGR